MATYVYECEAFHDGGRVVVASFELGVGVSGESWGDAARRATASLRAEVSRRLEAGEDVPKASCGNEPSHAGGRIMICCFDAPPDPVDIGAALEARSRLGASGEAEWPPPSCAHATRIGLLEVLQCATGCMYVSDLRTPANLPLIRHALRKVDAGAFGLREWDDAVEYITGENVRFERQSDAMGYLENYAGAHGSGEEGWAREWLVRAGMDPPRSERV